MDAFRAAGRFDRVHEACYIDPWFLAQIEDLIREEQARRKVWRDSKAGQAARARPQRRFLRQSPCPADGPQREGRTGSGAAQGGDPAGVQEGRHLRRGVRDVDGLPVFHLRAEEANLRQPQDR
ncbi:MAG: hypothetical protein R3E65_05755 [Steroidobacteraceae bacterium]